MSNNRNPWGATGAVCPSLGYQQLRLGLYETSGRLGRKMTSSFPSSSGMVESAEISNAPLGSNKLSGTDAQEPMGLQTTFETSVGRERRRRMEALETLHRHEMIQDQHNHVGDRPGHRLTGAVRPPATTLSTQGQVAFMRTH